ncbi:uncharacterized protein DSM5745_01862 [Aspergillus mulundensis]|uniref:Uncharacterized protein n=1 Tax=Aspergillus mulundensis TaxID=1810919 RepID=A0A3D8SUU2_9EURO|nr:hypothetical protein DSM5745_01862 [Aspergillus mulundensis]RDW90087.1 hypothetical protein DSM5745_01862 [Aspergillus mulundensis]
MASQPVKRAQVFMGSGKPEEMPVDMWIDDCRLLWLGTEYSDEDKNAGILATMLASIYGAALVYTHTLSTEIRSDWKKLAEALKAQYDLPGRRPLHPGIISRMVTLRQGERSLQDHIKNVREIAGFFGPQAKLIGVGCFVNSLEDKVLQKHILLIRQTMVACGKTDYTVEDLFKAALKWEETDWDQMKDKAGDFMKNLDNPDALKEYGHVGENGEFILEGHDGKQRGRVENGELMLDLTLD